MQKGDAPAVNLFNQQSQLVRVFKDIMFQNMFFPHAELQLPVDSELININSDSMMEAMI